MKITAISAFAMLVFLYPFSVLAMSVDGYRKTQADTSSSDAEVSLGARAVLLGYFQGISDTIEIMRRNGKISFDYSGAIPIEICVPESVKVSPTLIRLATDSEINEHNEIYSSSDPGWETYALPTYSMLGLRRMFPCGAP